MKDREREENDRLRSLDVIQPADRTWCGHYDCDQAASACFKRQTTTKTFRQGTVVNPQDPYCASGECETGRLIGEKLSEKVEGQRFRLAGMTLRSSRSKRSKAPRREVKKERAPMKGAGECKADGCNRRIRRDNRSGICWLCAQKQPWRSLLYGKKAG